MNEDLANEIIQVFFRLFVNEDATTVLHQWLRFSIHKEVTKDVHQILHLICLEPIQLSITKTQLKLFEGNDWAKIELNSLSSKTTRPLFQMTHPDYRHWFFKKIKVHSFDQEYYTDFLHNKVAEQILDRKKMILFLLRILLQFENKLVDCEKRLLLTNLSADVFCSFATKQLDLLKMEYYENSRKYTSEQIRKTFETLNLLIVISEKLKQFVITQQAKQSFTNINWKAIKSMFNNF